MMRTAGLAAWSFRMASRAWASAEAVTVQVLMTMISAAAGEGAEVQPRSSNWRSRAAPSACVARHPNCSMKKLGIGIAELRQKTFYTELAEYTESAENKRLHTGLSANPTKDDSPLWRACLLLQG